MEQQNKSPDLAELRKLAEEGSFEAFIAFAQHPENLVRVHTTLQASLSGYRLRTPQCLVKVELQKIAKLRAALARQGIRTRRLHGKIYLVEGQRSYRLLDEVIGQGFLV